MESVPPVCLFQAGYTVNVTSIGKEKPVISHTVKPTVAVQTMGTVIWQARSCVYAMTAGKVRVCYLQSSLFLMQITILKE